ncbi:MAG: cytochrome c biogenesis protein CcdA [Patescibacteria group bacterium]
MLDIPIVFAFIAGLVSFLAPCVLPLIPGYLAYLSGTTLDQSATRRWEIFLNALFFVLGFSLVFATLGVLLNTILESVAFDVLIWLSRIGGLIIIFFGLYLIGLIKLDFLNREYRLRVTFPLPRYFSSFIFGAAFAAGWTPCVGAVLGAILGLAATAPGSAFTLLLSYSLGFGTPFLLVGLFAGEAQKLISRLGSGLRYVNIIFGAILVIFGILIFTQNLVKIANFEFLYAL